MAEVLTALGLLLPVIGAIAVAFLRYRRRSKPPPAPSASRPASARSNSALWSKTRELSAAIDALSNRIARLDLLVASQQSDITTNRREIDDHEARLRHAETQDADRHALIQRELGEINATLKGIHR